MYFINRITILFYIGFFIITGIVQAAPIWSSQNSLNIGNSSAIGRTGQWWCDNHFGNNLGGAWECINTAADICNVQVPNNTTVNCGKLSADGTTPFNAENKVISPFGYGRVERVLVTQSALGRTGHWWCNNHFGGNLGGNWYCRSVSGANSCHITVPNNEVVSCSTSSAAVNEAAFNTKPCNDSSLDNEEKEFCNHTEYMNHRKRDTIYIYNDYIRAGINHSFGGTLFELYATDGVNRIEEHGGSAVQLSIWGYDKDAIGAAYFTTEVCSIVPYTSSSNCQANNNNVPCVLAPTSGAHISNCQTEVPCIGWSASSPWNPIQAQAENCEWNGVSNDIDEIAQVNNSGIKFTKYNPNQFIKSLPFNGLTWSVVGDITDKSPYIKLTYKMSYSGQAVGEHDQEIPAIFTDEFIGYWYYFYDAGLPYTNSQSTVTRARSDFTKAINGIDTVQLKLPHANSNLPAPAPEKYFNASEAWMSVCDKSEDYCLTVASFHPEIKIFSMDGSYITPKGRFALNTSYNSEWDIYLFPYRYDEVVHGKTIRQWVYDLKAAN